MKLGAQRWFQMQQTFLDFSTSNDEAIPKMVF